MIRQQAVTSAPRLASQEEELERAVVPESAAAEEERLRQERAAEAETVKQVCAELCCRS